MLFSLSPSLSFPKIRLFLLPSLSSLFPSNNSQLFFYFPTGPNPLVTRKQTDKKCLNSKLKLTLNFKQNYKNIIWTFQIHAMSSFIILKPSFRIAWWNLMFHCLEACLRPYMDLLSLQTLCFYPLDSKHKGWSL